MKYSNPTPQMILPPQARVPDNTNNLNLIARLGNQLALGKAQDKQEENQERAQVLANTLLNGTPAEKQQAKIDLAAQEQVEMVQNQADQAKMITRSNENKQRMLTEPESKSALIELNQLDPQMAAFVMDTMAADDANSKAQIAGMAQQSLSEFTNIRAIASSPELGGVDAARQYAGELAKRYQQQGINTNKLDQLAEMEGDEFIQGAIRNQALAGAVLKVPDVQKAVILSDGAQMRGPNGELIAENKKDAAPVDPAKRELELRSLQEREKANKLARDKFENSKGNLSAAAEKELMKAQDSAQSSNLASSELQSLSQEFANVSGSGATARWSEKIKEFAGNEDAITSIRRKYNQLKNSQVMKSLPPGVASDKDIEIAMSGFLDSTANPAEVSKFLLGMSKMESINASYQQFKSDWLSENGNTRGMLRAWDDASKQIKFDTAAAPSSDATADDAALFEKYGIN